MSTVNQRPSVHFIKPSQVSVGICGFATPAKKYRTRNVEKTTCEACKTEARKQRFLCAAETPAPELAVEPKKSSISSHLGMVDLKDVHKLKVHSLNQKIYGDSEPDEDLLRSIQEHGIINPLVIDVDKRILSGTRRWLAAKKLGHKTVPCFTLRYDPNHKWGTKYTNSDESQLIGELLLVESNRQRIKTEAQKDAEAATLLRIEKELAAIRQRAGVRQNLAEGGKAVEKVAAITGESPETIRKRVEIHEAKVPAEERNQRSTHAAFQEIQNEKRRRNFRKANPEFADKTDAEVDAAIKAKYGDAPAQLKKSQVSPSGASVSSTVENPSTSVGSNPTAPLQNSNDVIDGVEVPRHKNGNRCSDCVITLNNKRGFCSKHNSLASNPAPKFTATWSKTQQLREFFGKQYPYFSLRPSEIDQRVAAAGKSRHRTDRYDLILMNLTAAEIKAISGLFQTKQAVKAA